MQTVFTGLDHHRQEGLFATCGQQVDIWDEQRSSPIRSFTWGVDSFSSVNFNPVEVRQGWGNGPCPVRDWKKAFLATCSENRQLFKSVFLVSPPQTELLASCASDRSVVLYDMRESTPLKKVAAENSLCCVPVCWVTYHLCVLAGDNDNEEQHTVLEPHGSLLLHSFEWGLQVGWWHVYFVCVLGGLFLTCSCVCCLQSVHVWHEVPGKASPGAHRPRLCCAGCWLFPHREGVRIR